MTYYFVGLGNPGAEYEDTRHNAGRMALEFFRHAHKWPEWKLDKKINALVSGGALGKHTIKLVLPEGQMNRSGKSVAPLITSVKKAETLVVLHDDLDLALGKLKISFGRGAGGHRGVDSIMKAIKTKDFVRVRIGVSPATPKGKVKKPNGEEAIVDFILGKFKPAELVVLKTLNKKIAVALETITSTGRAAAMNEFNSL